MGKNKLIKWILPLSLGVMIGLGINTAYQPVSADSISATTTPIVIASQKKVTIYNEKLNTAIRNLLGKTKNEILYSDAFINHPSYSETAENPIYQIDLSNTGVTDIRELIQFTIPAHIGGINLAGNGITNDHLNAITDALNCTEDSTLVVGEITYTSASDVSNIIKKVNLNDNNIDLDNIDSNHLNNTKFLFGVQNLNTIHHSGLVEAGEVKAKYYIRSNSDENYLTYTFTQAMSTHVGEIITPTRDIVTDLANPSINDRYSVTVSSIPDSSTAYFKGYEFFKEFIQFSLEIDEDFRVERYSLANFGITANYKLMSDSPIKINGFGNNENLKVKPQHLFTERITTPTVKHYVRIGLEYNGKIRDNIEREIIIIDTIAPVIELKGSSHAYSSKNRDYKDPGFIAYDPCIKGNTEGIDLYQMVIVNNKVDVTTLGEYTITYTVSDGANTTTVTRIVEIQESVLDHITLKTTSTELVEGKDIVLVVQPDNYVDISKYKDIKYYWYNNGVLFETTTGDTSSGKSSITIIGDSNIDQNITVKLTAIQKSDNAEIILFSDELNLDVKKNVTDNTTIIIATAVVVLLALGGLIVITILNAKKRKGKTHSKHKNFHKGKPNKKTNSEQSKEQTIEIQVIKDYRGDTSGGDNGEGGNANFRPMENKSQDGKDNQNQ